MCILALALGPCLAPGFASGAEVGADDYPPTSMVPAPSPSELPALAGILRRGTWNHRIQAANRLGHMGPAAIETLSAALWDDDWQVRLTAVHWLGRLGPDSIPALAGAMDNDPCRIVRVTAIHWLGSLGDEALDALAASGGDGSRAVRLSQEYWSRKITSAEGERDPYTPIPADLQQWPDDDMNADLKRCVTEKVPRRASKASPARPGGEVPRGEAGQAASGAGREPAVGPEQPGYSIPAGSADPFLEPSAARRPAPLAAPPPGATPGPASEPSPLPPPTPDMDRLLALNTLNDEPADQPEPAGSRVPYPALPGDDPGRRPAALPGPQALAPALEPLSRRLGEEQPPLAEPPKPSNVKPGAEQPPQGRAGTPRAAPAPELARLPKPPGRPERLGDVPRVARPKPGGQAGPDELLAGVEPPPPGHDPIPDLLAALTDPNPRNRHRAADELGKRGAAAAAAVDPLIAALKDPVPAVRSSAALALGNIGKPSGRAVPAITRMLRDRSADVRESAAVALGRIGTKEARRAFQRHLREEAERLIGREGGTGPR